MEPLTTTQTFALGIAAGLFVMLLVAGLGRRPLLRIAVRKFHRLQKSQLNPGGIDIPGYPVFHQFPNIGANGEISIDCGITPSTWPFMDCPVLDQKSELGGVGITPHCVGAMYVIVDQAGLHLRWKPGEKLEESTLFTYPRHAVVDKPGDGDANNTPSPLDGVEGEQ